MSARAYARALLALAFLAACHRGGDSGPQPPAPVAMHGSAVLMVENHHFTDINIFLTRGGQRIRVGQVSATGSATFEVPERMFGPLGTFRLIADPIGERASLQSDIISIRPGLRIEWILESKLVRSSLAVY